MKKQEIYINLQGKTKEELTDLWEFLTSNGEKCYRDLKSFLEYPQDADPYIGFFKYHKNWSNAISLKDRKEVTIEKLKQIIKPMGTKFKPIAMKCNKEQFEAIKPKLVKVGKIGNLLFAFEYDNIYLVNNYSGEKLLFDISVCYDYKREIHEEWNEEIFLKACGIEVDSLEQQLQKAEAEVKRLRDEIKYKVGDEVTITITESNRLELIKLLENEYSK